ncbi:ABC transporter ATP-binding protein [Romboutsia sp.]|uniref:ABC transporter ATP-binding protein n=1 Tax=Romboutsia sp. TaxID=1965302 RepID=UPI003F34E8AC
MKSTINKFKWIFSQGKSYMPLLILSIIIGSILSSVSVYNAVISKYLIDAATSGQSDKVIKWLIIIGLIILFDILFSSIESLLATYCYKKIANNLEYKFFKNITYSEWIESSKYHSVELMTKITSDTSTVNFFLCNTVPTLITSSVMLVFAFFTLLQIEPILATTTFLIFPLLAIINKLLGRKMKKLYNDLQDKNIEYFSFLQENLQNLMLIKTFSHEKKTINTLTQIQNEKFKLSLNQLFLTLLTGALFSLGSSAAYLLVFGWGALNLVNGIITFGTMTAMLQLFYKIQEPLNALIGCYSPIISALTATERLIELEHLDPEIHSDRSNLSLFNKPTIAFNNISFSYDNNVDILRKVSFKIKPGEIVALVGPSGEGKTTLIRLLLSLINPTNGKITIENENLIEEVCNNHRELISYIPQGNTLFTGTIEENICFGNTEASFEDIIEACEQSCSLDFIKALEGGLNTKLGEKGTSISDGQAQRLAIARAFVRKKPILILDEATSALDSNTELKVLKSVKELGHNPTCIIITHRPNSLSICDRILKLENGNLIEEDLRYIYEVSADLA